MRRTAPGHLFLLLVAISVVLLVVWNNRGDETSEATVPAIDRAGLHPAVVKRIDERIGALEQSFDSAASWGTLGVVLDLHDLQAPAIECYLQAIDRDPAQFIWPYFAGICATIGNRDRALQFFATAHKLDADYPPLLIRQGLLILQGGETEKARALFEQAMSFDDTLIQGHLGLARCFMIDGDLDSAGRALDRCDELQPTAGEVAATRSMWWQGRGETDQAALSLELSRNKTPREPLPDPLRNDAVMSEGVGPQWWIERSRRLVEANRIDAALDLWRGALAEDPENPEFHYQMARVAERTADHKLIISHYLAATLGDPRMAKGFSDFGAFLLKIGNRSAAEKALRSALQLAPDSDAVQGNLGALLMSGGNSEEGIPLLEAARDASPGNADVRFNLAMAWKTIGDNARASEEFSAVLQLDPARTRARFEWGMVLAELGQLDQAAEQFSQIVASEPTREAAWVNLARAYLGNQRYKNAITTLRSAREKLPKNGKIAADLAWLLATCPEARWRNGAEAEQIAVLLCEGVGSTHPSSFDIWAASLAELGDFEGAVEKAQQALGLFDDNPGNPRQRSDIEQRLQGYLARMPYRLEN